MARGSKKKYTRKQKRKAEKIARGYKKRGVSKKEASRRAWATVNKSDRGGRKKGGGGRGKRRNKSPMRKGGRKGGRKRKRR
jgi:plasmid stabilization system protein ParE